MVTEGGGGLLALGAHLRAAQDAARAQRAVEAPLARTAAVVRPERSA